MDSPPSARSVAVVAALLAALAAGCDGGLAPPDAPPTGAILGSVSYTGRWPAPDSLQDLRFVAMRFVPQDTADFLDLSRLVFSPRGLDRYVESDSFLVEDVAPGPYLYSGVAQQYAPSLFAWRPVGLYADDDGVLFVRPGETTRVSVSVDFSAPPPFPPR